MAKKKPNGPTCNGETLKFSTRQILDLSLLEMIELKLCAEVLLSSEHMDSLEDDLQKQTLFWSCQVRQLSLILALWDMDQEKHVTLLLTK